MGRVLSFQSIYNGISHSRGLSILWAFFVLSGSKPNVQSKIVSIDTNHSIYSHSIIFDYHSLPETTSSYYCSSSLINRNYKALLLYVGCALCWFPSKGKIFSFSIFITHITSKHPIALPEGMVQPWLWIVLFVRGP